MIKIVDFGLATRLNYTAAGNPIQPATPGIGTPGFAAPEQWNESAQGNYDERVDLFSVACTLYHMVTKDYVVPSEPLEDVITGDLIVPKEPVNVPEKFKEATKNISDQEFHDSGVVQEAAAVVAKMIEPKGQRIDVNEAQEIFQDLAALTTFWKHPYV